MSKPVVVTIPHSLGKEEAIRRLQGGLQGLRGRFGDTLKAVQETWQGDRMDFSVHALGQGIQGHIDVFDDSVRLEMRLPWMLAMFAEKAKALVSRQGQLMLEKK